MASSKCIEMRRNTMLAKTNTKKPSLFYFKDNLTLTKPRSRRTVSPGIYTNVFQIELSAIALSQNYQK